MFVHGMVKIILQRKVQTEQLPNDDFLALKIFFNFEKKI
jgi:hypothetical protein